MRAQLRRAIYIPKQRCRPAREYYESHSPVLVLRNNASHKLIGYSEDRHLIASNWQYKPKSAKTHSWLTSSMFAGFRSR